MSQTFAKVTLLLLLIALAVTAPLAYFDWRVLETPPVAETIGTQLVKFPSVATDRGRSISREFASDDWVERRYATGANRDVTLAVVRSYDMKRLYHHPELAIVKGLDLEGGGVRSVPSPTGAVDVHMLHGRTGQGAAAYALLYRDQTVSDPLTFQMRTALEPLLLGRRPLTLVFAVDREHDVKSDTPTPAIDLVIAAVAALRDRS